MAQPILLIEDNEDDTFLIRRAIQQAHRETEVMSLPDGEEAICYITGSGKYSDREAYPSPCFIVVDLKMPRVSGLQFLAWLRDNPDYRRTPVVVLTSSEQTEDVERAYQLGAHSYIVKPSDYPSLIKMARAAFNYWARIIRPDAQALN